MGSLRKGARSEQRGHGCGLDHHGTRRRGHWCEPAVLLRGPFLQDCRGRTVRGVGRLAVGPVVLARDVVAPILAD